MKALGHQLGATVFAVAILALSGGFLQAAIIIEDTFTAANNTALIPFSGVETNRSPSPTNVPGGTYQTTGGGGGDGSYVNNAARMHNGGAVGLALGTYNDNTVLSISADLYFSNTASPVQTSGYALLGFFNAASTGQYQSALSKFTGLRLNLNGSLQLYIGGAASGSAITFVGTYDPASYATLSYTIDTDSGAISDVTFGNSSATYNFITTGFTNARTEYAGFGGSLGNTQNYVFVDNFQLEVIPEPASLVLFCVGGILIGLRTPNVKWK